MRKICILTFLLAIICEVNAQKIMMNYKGTKTFMNEMDATESYPYFEQNGIRVKHGNYMCAGIYQDYPRTKVSVSVEGKFQNGLATGKWTASFAGLMNKTNFVKTFTGNYVNGLPHGVWSIKIEAQEIGSHVEVSNITCQFKKGKLVGKYDSDLRIQGNTDPITKCVYVFDESGYLNQDDYTNGFYKNDYIKNYDTTINVRFEGKNLLVMKDEGFLSLLTGDVSGGGLPSNVDCFNALSVKNNFILQSAGYMDTIYVSRNWIEADYDRIEKLIQNYISKGQTKKADKIQYLYDLSSANYFYDKNDYKNAKDLYTATLKYKDDIQLRKRIDSLQNQIVYDSIMSLANQKYKIGQTDEAVILCKKAKLTISDETSPDLLIKKIEKENEDYKLLIDKANNEYSVRNYENAKKLFHQAQKIKLYEKLPVESINKIESEYKELIQKAEKSYTENDFDNSVKLYKEILLYNQEYKNAKDRISKIEQTNSEIVKNNELIKTEKGKLEPQLNKLYKKVYASVNTFIENQLINEKDIFKQVVIQQQLMKFYSTISNLLINRNKDLEKQLKEVETPEQYIRILNI